MSLKSIRDISNILDRDPPRYEPLRPGADRSPRYHPSPQAWEDKFLYFLLPDRFSDNNEGTSTLYDGSQNGNAVNSPENAATWRNAGTRFVGGTIAGIESKLAYLKNLGVSALWVGPIFKQVKWETTYHGYGVQDFLDIDPRFGTRDDLKKLVEAAHKQGIYVILDIILNHSGDVFKYALESPAYTGKTYDVTGFYAAQNDPSLPLGPVGDDHFPDGAVWPQELQNSVCFTRKGQIRPSGWDTFPEYIDGDFYALKDIALGDDRADNFYPPAALTILSKVYKYWIAFADIDGYRIDTVKHMGDGPTRFFASVIHEYAQNIGKNNFLLMGEITGTRAFETMETTGLDVALGVGQVQEKLWKVPSGDVNPNEYFDLFRNALYLNKGSHTWFRDKVVTMLDDHDQVWGSKEIGKARFCSQLGNANLVASAIMLNLCTLGIPCIYYGTEQAFDGAGGGDGADRYIREAMFGGDFGAFRSRGCHFFNDQHSIYLAVARIVGIRNQEMALRRGRQYLRDISGDPDKGFGPIRKMD